MRVSSIKRIKNQSEKSESSLICSWLWEIERSKEGSVAIRDRRKKESI